MSKQYILDTPYGGNTPCALQLTRYASPRRLALQLWTVDEDFPEPLATVSVNLPDDEIAADEFFCKDWSENEGMCDWLEENGIAKRTGRIIPTDFVAAEVMKLSPELYKEFVK